MAAVGIMQHQPTSGMCSLVQEFMRRSMRVKLLFVVSLLVVLLCICNIKWKREEMHVEKKRPFQGGNVKRETCYVTQSGQDGFGHQMEGKLSCIYASIITSSFHYVHTPFHNFEHTKMDAEMVEKFANLGEGFEHANALVTNHSFTVIPHERGGYSNDFVCHAGEIHSFDNCWPMSYKPPVVNHLGDIGYLKQVRKLYFATPKPETGFEKKENRGRPNVVIHVRRGDAGGRIIPEIYFERAIKFYRKELPNPLFWFESDEPNWSFFVKMREQSPLDFRLPNASETHLTVFHRMVMADGLVCSYSGFSLAPAMLSLASPIVITSYVFDGGLREDWFKTKRFVRISQDNTSEALPARRLRA